MLNRIQLASGIVADTIGDDTIVINISTGAYYALTPLGAQVWQEATGAAGDVSPPEDALRTFVDEGLLVTDRDLTVEAKDAESLYTKYSDMEDLLIADPIHEVGADGWPQLL